MTTEQVTAKCPNGWHRSAPARARQLCPECATGREVYDPFWVRNLVEHVGRELHDLDRLAEGSDESPDTPWSRGHRAGLKSAAEYLTSDVTQSVERLGLADVMAAARAGKGTAELAAIPQSREA